MLEYERHYWKEHPGCCLAGIDEVGRGPLAGPVVAAAVIIDPGTAEKGLKSEWSNLTDSKQLSPNERERFAGELQNREGVWIGLGVTTAAEVDELNVLYATYRAMARAVEALQITPCHALVDGLPVQGLPCESTAIVHGDSRSLLIAAASVIAKVTRDQMMAELSKRYPGYGFALNKGYGTAKHIRALLKLGPCPEHRRSFRPVAESNQLRLINYED